MLGNYVNTITIIIGSLLGLLVHKGLKEEYKIIVMQAIGLSVLFIGATTAIGGLLDPDSEPILFIISLVIGGVVGELVGLEKGLEKVGMSLQRMVTSDDQKSEHSEHNVARGFVTASLIFCVGTMAIIGSLESGLRGNYDMLFAKSVLDGVTSMILASTLGIGVIFSAGMVFLYQGAIILFAGSLEPFLTVNVIREISIIGGILILGIGLSMMEIKKIKTVNLLPAIFVPVIYYFVVIPMIRLFS
ncbi:MAG: DUF554 domain-containing protein [Bacillota bacterium]|nr:DUF554 domain-containing protein [Bacillota bacterium]